jgi:hypothetical protein
MEIAKIKVSMNIESRTTQSRVHSLSLGMQAGTSTTIVKDFKITYECPEFSQVNFDGRSAAVRKCDTVYRGIISGTSILSGLTTHSCDVMWDMGIEFGSTWLEFGLENDVMNN